MEIVWKKEFKESKRGKEGKNERRKVGMNDGMME